MTHEQLTPMDRVSAQAYYARAYLAKRHRADVQRKKDYKHARYLKYKAHLKMRALIAAQTLRVRVESFGRFL